MKVVGVFFSDNSNSASWRRLDLKIPPSWPLINKCQLLIPLEAPRLLLLTLHSFRLTGWHSRSNCKHAVDSWWEFVDGKKGGKERSEKKNPTYSRFKQQQQQQPDSVTLAVWILFGICLRVPTHHVGTWWHSLVGPGEQNWVAKGRWFTPSLLV